MMIINIISRIVSGTPFYVWVIFIFLLKRGIKASKDGELSFSKMFIMPSIFIIWGLEKLLSGFSYLGTSMIFYTIFMCLGILISYSLYSRYRKLYIKEGSLCRTGSYLPMTIMMTNFFVKYLLNVAMNVNPLLCNTLSFNILYALLSGFSVGLFIGGILQAYNAYSSLKAAL
jgi:teichoic acid transport system permease protein